MYYYIVITDRKYEIYHLAIIHYKVIHNIQNYYKVYSTAILVVIICIIYFSLLILFLLIFYFVSL